MASPPEKMLTISCPGCAARFRVSVSMTGRSGRCARCGTIVIVAPHTPGAQPEKAAGAPAPAETPQYIGVECHVCQTRMYGTPDQVGKRFKCPDCGALTELPPPPKAKVKRAPKALEGDQYEVWEADEQPLPSELIARQPVYIAVVCRMCETLMYATEGQVGQTLTCPDCGTPHVVPAPPKPKAKPSVVSPDAVTPMLDPAADPGERPPVLIPPTRKLDFEERQEAEYARALEKSRRTGKPIRIDVRGRPILPRWPLVTGIVRFPFSRGAPIRWLALSAGLFVVGSLLMAALSMLISMRPAQTGISPDAMGALAGVPLLAAGGIFGVLWAAAAASIWLTIVTESSEGNDQIQDWPANPIQWFPDLFYLAIALPVSAFPGWLVAQFAADDPTRHAAWIVSSMWLCFPVTLLSELEVSSPWAVVSGRVLWGLLRRPFSSVLFFVESAVLLAACGAATFEAAAVDPNLPLLLVPVYVLAGLVYGRLLGRLAWRLAEAAPTRE